MQYFIYSTNYIHISFTLCKIKQNYKQALKIFFELVLIRFFFALHFLTLEALNALLRLIGKKTKKK
jgi:hypothetical protein